MPLPPAFVNDTTLEAAALNAATRDFFSQLEVPAGVSAGRPTGLTQANRGRIYFDTQKGALEIWNGSAWVGISVPLNAVLSPQGISNLGAPSYTPSVSRLSVLAPRRPAIWMASFGAGSGGVVATWDIFVPPSAPVAGTTTFRIHIVGTQSASNGGVRFEAGFQRADSTGGGHTDITHPSSTNWTKSGANATLSGKSESNLTITVNSTPTPGVHYIFGLIRQGAHSFDTYSASAALVTGTMTIAG